MNHSIGDAKHASRVFALRVFEPSGKTAQVLAVEQRNDFARHDGRRRIILAKRLFVPGPRVTVAEGNRENK